MKPIKILLVLLVAGTLFSCNKKDDNVAPTPSVKKLLLIHVSYSTGGAFSYQYDAQKRLSEINYEYPASPDLNYTNTLTYNSAGAPTGMEVVNSNGINQRLAYDYNNDGTLNKVEHYSTANGAAETHDFDELFSYSPGAITVKKNNVADDTVVMLRGCSIDAAKNISELKYYNIHTGVLRQTTTYHGYDDKKNINTLLPAAYYEITSANNPLSATNNVNGSDNNSSYYYEYNDEGYPVKSTMIYGSQNDTINTEFTYEKR